MTDAQIFIAVDKGRSWLALEDTPYDPERLLKLALSNSPELLPGDQIDPARPRRWLSLQPKLNTAELASHDATQTTTTLTHGGLDALVLDQDGIPTFVECRRADDPTGCREAVTRLLGYASGGSIYWSTDNLRQLAEQAAADRGHSLEEALDHLLANEDLSAEDFWPAVADNFAQGRLRLILASNAIPDDLIHLLQFLNAKMADISFLAIEYRLYQGQNQSALVPRLINLDLPDQKKSQHQAKTQTKPSAKSAANPPATPTDRSQAQTMGNGRSQSQPTSPVSAPVQPTMSKSEAVKARPAQKVAGEPNPSRDWDEAHFFSELATQAQEPEVQVARQIYNWAKKKTSQVEWSASGSRGFYAPILSHEGRNCRLFTVTSNGWLELELNRLRVHPPFNDPGKRRELLEQLDAIREITLPEDVLAAKYALALRPFTNPAVLSQFLKVFEWAITEVMLGNGLASLALDWSAEPADETGDDLNGNDFSSY